MNHRPSHWTRFVALVLLGGSLVVVSLLLRAPVPTAAAAATATTGTPTADECTVAPRSLPLPGGDATPTTPEAVATEFVPPTGSPADTGIKNAVTVTVRESVACANAGDLLRGLALYTDHFLANQLVGPTGITQENMALLASTPPAAAPASDRLSLVAVQDVIQLADGRVGATVITRNADGTFEDYLFFARVGNNWLIDEAVRLQSPNGTPIP
jgi:hypothetical protein